MDVAADPQRCQGHARCWDLCPEVFALDEEGHAFAAEPAVPPEFESKARQACANCPERAIVVS